MRSCANRAAAHGARAAVVVFSALLTLATAQQFLTTDFSLLPADIVVHASQQDVTTDKLSDDPLFRVLLRFSHDMPISGQDLVGLLQIQLKKFVPGVDYTYTIDKIDARNYMLNLALQSDFYNKTLIIYFTNPLAIVDTSGQHRLALESYRLRCSVGPFLRLSTSSQNFVWALWYINVIFLIGLPVAYIVMRTLVSQRLTIFWSLVDYFQVFNLILMTDSLMLVNVRVPLQPTFYANFVPIHAYRQLDDAVSGGYVEDYTTTQVVVKQIGLTTNFVTNAFVPMLLLGAALITTLIFGLIKGRPTIENIFSLSGFTQAFFYGIPIAAHLMTSCQIFHACFLQFQNNSNIRSLLISIVFFLWMVAFYWFANRVTNSEETIPLEQPQIRRLYGQLYEGLETKAVFKRNLYLFWGYRKFLLAMMVVFVSNENIWQIFWVALIQIVYTTIVFVKYPFISSVSNYCNMVSESMVAAYVLGLNGWAVWDYLGEDFVEFSTRNSLSWVLIILYFLGLLVRVVGMAFEFKQIYIQEHSQVTNQNRKSWEIPRKVEDGESIDEYHVNVILTIGEVHRKDEENKNQPEAEESEEEESRVDEMTIQQHTMQKTTMRNKMGRKF